MTRDERAGATGIAGATGEAAEAGPQAELIGELIADPMPDLRERLLRTRRVATPWGDDAARGVPAARLDALLERWASGYDWAVHARRIRALPWATVRTAGGAGLRLVHQRAADPGAPVVVLLHGWPDSVLRFERVLPLLADLNVVVPALPGFPFAAPLIANGVSAGMSAGVSAGASAGTPARTSAGTPARPSAGVPDGVPAGASANRIAALVADALEALGYARYTLSGGDVGGTVAEILAGRHPDRVAALHLTNVAPQRALTADPAALAPDAAAYLGRAARWFRGEGGYIAEQSTRPNTLAVALGDSPAGLAAWLVEKLDAWSDGPQAFTPDELLTWVTAYWAGGTIGTSFATYAEPAALPGKVGTPTVLSVFAHDTKPEPRSYAEAFLNVRAYVEHGAGGHFAAWERPEEYAGDVRRAVGLGIGAGAGG